MEDIEAGYLIMSWNILNALHTFIHLCNINLNITHLRLDLPSGLFSWGFPTKAIFTCITVMFRRNRYWPLSWARRIQSTKSHPRSKISILLSSSAYDWVSHVLRSIHVLQLKLWAFLIPPTRDLITLVSREEERMWLSSMCYFLEPSATSSLLGPNILQAPCLRAPSIHVHSLI
jgi:hypothetical protein